MNTCGTCKWWIGEPRDKWNRGYCGNARFPAYVPDYDNLTDKQIMAHNEYRPPTREDFGCTLWEKQP